MPRVLIVSPHFPPTNAPPIHRVRTLLPFFRENGWQAEVLAVVPRCVAAPVDDWLVGGLPAGVVVHRADALGLGWSKVPGLGSLGFRSLPALMRIGDQIIANRNFDLVYFSTTVFEVHILGPRWVKKFGVPFVMDYQDPWVSDYYRDRPTVVPPGGRIKYRLASALGRWMEPLVLSKCSGITSVSPEYPVQLRRRYTNLPTLPSLVQPFAAARHDFQRAVTSEVVQDQFRPDDGKLHWVYAGVIVPSMLPIIRALFRAIAGCMSPLERSSLALHFIGTRYAAVSDPTHSQLRDIAAEFGIADLVYEKPARIPYSETLKCMLDANALLAFGTDDPGYTPSKIFPCLLASKPLLALYHYKSPVVAVLAATGGAVCLTFSDPFDEDAVVAQIGNNWVAGNKHSITVPVDALGFEKYLDRNCARDICSFFDSIVR